MVNREPWQKGVIILVTNQLLTVKQVAKIINVDPNTIYRWERDGLIQAVRFGRMIRFSQDEVDRILKNKEGVFQSGK